MAKFNIEVELDWVDGEDGYTIDEEIKEQVVSGIKDALLKKATTEAVEAVDDMMKYRFSISAVEGMVAAGSQRLQIQDSITVPEEQDGIRAYSLRI